MDPTDNPTSQETPDVPNESTAVEETPALSDGPAPDAPSQTPWSADLESTFDDPDTRARVDEFVRAKIQPYVTKLEEQGAPDRNAQRLWDSFHKDPSGTFKQIAGEIYGDDAAQRIVAVVTDDDGDVRPVVDDQGDVGDGAEVLQLEDLPAEVQEIVRADVDRRQRESYEEQAQQVKEELEGDKDFTDAGGRFEEELFHPFVISAEGDFDLAKDAYRKWALGAKEAFGLKLPEPGEVEPPAPQTLNSNTPTPAVTPPQEKQYDSFGDAIDDWFDERNQAPPVVGAT